MENLHQVSYYNTKTFSALNYAQDFGTIVNWLYRCEEGYTHEKSNCPVSKYFHAFVSTLNYVSPIGAVTKEDEVVMGDRIDNFRPILNWQWTIRSESTQDKAET